MMMTKMMMMKMIDKYEDDEDYVSVTMVVLVMFGCWGQIMTIIMMKMMMTKIRMMKIMCMLVSVVGG